MRIQGVGGPYQMAAFESLCLSYPHRVSGGGAGSPARNIRWQVQTRYVRVRQRQKHTSGSSFCHSFSILNCFFVAFWHPFYCSSSSSSSSSSTLPVNFTVKRKTTQRCTTAAAEGRLCYKTSCQAHEGAEKKKNTGKK